jgi:hypothetical protein
MLEHVWKISRKFSCTFIRLLMVNGVMVISQDEVVDMLSSFFDLVWSSASYASVFLQLNAHEGSHHYRFTAAATEPYDPPYCVAERKSALMHMWYISPSGCHSQPNAETSAFFHLGILVEHVQLNLEWWLLSIKVGRCDSIHHLKSR